MRGEAHTTVRLEIEEVGRIEEPLGKDDRLTRTELDKVILLEDASVNVSLPQKSVGADVGLCPPGV